MLNKLLILLAVISINAFGQFNSVYSNRGIGLPEYGSSIRQMGIGGLNVTGSDGDFLNTANPASLSDLSITRFEMGQVLGAEILKNSSQSNFYGGAYFNGFTFAVPVSGANGVGVAIGMSDVSRMKYESKENITDPTNGNIVPSTITGIGGMTKLYLAGSYVLPYGISVGASLDYYSAKYERSTMVDYSLYSYQNSTFNYTDSYKGVGGTFGFISPDLAPVLKLGKSLSDVKFGATLTTSAKLTGDMYQYLSTSSGLKDTSISKHTEMSMPDLYTFGLSVKAFETYNISLNIALQSWSKFTKNDVSDASLQNSAKYTLGVENKPKILPGQSDIPIIWRMGLGYEKTPYLINGTSINQFMVSAGASLPISRLNYVDLSIQYISRGTTDSGLLKEDIIKLGVGFSLGELWFVRNER